MGSYEQFADPADIHQSPIYNPALGEYLDEHPYALGRDGDDACSASGYAVATDHAGAYALASNREGLYRNPGFYALGTDSSADHYQNPTAAGYDAHGEGGGFYHSERERDPLYNYRTAVGYTDLRPNGAYESPSGAVYSIPGESNCEFYSILGGAADSHDPASCAYEEPSAAHYRHYRQASHDAEARGHYTLGSDGHYTLGSDGYRAGEGLYSLGAADGSRAGAIPSLGGHEAGLYHLATDTDGPSYALASSVEDPSS